MRTIKTNIYTICELKGKALETALSNVRNVFEHRFYTESDYDKHIVNSIEAFGYINPDIRYSFGYSTGDGFSFSADGYDIDRLTKILISIMGKNKSKSACIVANSIEAEFKGNRGSHAFCGREQVDVYLNAFNNTNYKNLDRVVGELCERVETMYINCCNMFKKEISSRLSEINSDDFAKTIAEMEGVEFYADGSIFNKI